MNSSLSIRASWPHSPLRIVFSRLAIFSAVTLYFGITRTEPIPMLFAIAMTVIFAIEISGQTSKELDLPSSIRAFWPYVPLKIVFSVLAILSAVPLYLGIPRLAQSPMLFAITAMVLFALEAWLFEFGFRHVGRRAFPSLGTLSKRMAVLFMKWGGHNLFYMSKGIETPLGLLTLFDAAGGRILEFSFFLTVAWSKSPHPASCPYTVPFKQWIACSWQAALPCALVVIIGLVFTLSRRNAKKELFIAQKLFPGEHVPDHWIGPRDLASITISVILFFTLYGVLAWLSENIVIVSSLMLMTACIDFNTIRVINARADTYLKDPEYAPRPEDKDYNLICERRDVIRNYLYKKPHLWKEAARAAGFTVAFGIAISGARSLSYVVLMATLILNELVIWKWHAERDRALVPLLARPVAG